MKSYTISFIWKEDFMKDQDSSSRTARFPAGEAKAVSSDCHL